MKLRTPVYFAVATALCLYVGLASRNGWSLVSSLTPGFLRPAAAATQHK